MAADKKTTAKVEAPKAAVTKKAEEVKASEAPVQTKAVEEKAAAVKEPVKKEPAKRGPKKATEVKAEKKTPGRKKGSTNVKKEELTTGIHIQFSGKEYSQDDLIKIAKDVWKYDLKQKVGDLASVELYIKPEEGKVYYVMNKDFAGDFDI